MARTFRQAGGWAGKAWHFCSNCPDWPTLSYTTWDGWGSPNKWNWCRSCIEIEKQGRCGGRKQYW